MATELRNVSPAGEIKASDRIIFYSPDEGDLRVHLLSTIVEYVGEQLGVGSGIRNQTYVTEYHTPITGGIITVSAGDLSDRNTHVIVKGSNTLASLTVTMPPHTKAADGQELMITFQWGVTNLSFSGNGAAVFASPSSVNSEDTLKFRYVKADLTWYKVV